ncbi:MAG: hypothetical protein O9262_14885, partial [Cyclobacteriaceae bacterium]|nr:hypothetical protein [Cyclobacteriaceae bacterium]
MMYLIALLPIALLTFFLIKVWKKASADIKFFFLPALLLHVVAGVGLGLLYVYHYGENDTLIYF